MNKYKVTQNKKRWAASFKKNTVIVFFLVLIIPLIAQVNTSNSEDINIQLPDMITSVEGNGILLEQDSIPDFSVLLPSINTELPTLADSGIISSEFVPPNENTLDSINEQSVFIEGRVGVGFPGYFVGDFSIYSNKGKNPFSLDFSHTNTSQYVFGEQKGNFNNTATLIDGKKQFNYSDVLNFNLAASYNSSIFGLQNQSPLFYNMFSQQAKGNVGVNWQFTNFWNLSGNLSGEYLTQYVGFNGNTVEGEKTSDYSFVIAPKLNLTFTSGEFKFNMGLEYDIGVSQNRLDIGIGVDYNFYPLFNAFATANLLVLPNNSSLLLIPFTIGISSGDNLPIGFNLKGGIRSNPADLSNIQSQFPFMFSESNYNEETEWYGNIELNIPFKNGISIYANGDYAQTAFGGGRLLPSSSLNSTTGLFVPTVTDVLILDSELKLAWNFDMFGISALWNSVWFDNPYDKSKQEIALVFSAFPKSGKWGGEIVSAFDITGKNVPTVSISSFWKIAKSISLELEVKDIVSLVTNKSRVLWGEYVKPAGNVSMFVKMFF